jgi:transposase
LEEFTVPLKLNHIIGVSGLSLRACEFHSGRLWVKAHISTRPHCPNCGASKKHLHLKEHFWRNLQHDVAGNRPTLIDVRVPKFRCRKCGRCFRQPIPGVMSYQRSTESFRMDVATKHQLGISKDACAKLFRISHSKVERCYKYVHQKELAERKNRPCPRIIGIDEHFLNRKIGYVTTMVDLKSHRVFDLLPGRSAQSLDAHLKRLKSRERVRVVVMDLSSTYRSIVQKYFPNATIVADRFHVVRMINHSLLNVWKQFDEQGRKHRGLLSLMRRHRFKLSDEQRLNLARYFKEYPALGICYHRLKDLKA